MTTQQSDEIQSENNRLKTEIEKLTEDQKAYGSIKGDASKILKIKSDNVRLKKQLVISLPV